jgi:hypothetical protein
VAFVENKYHALILQRFQPLLVVFPVCTIQREAELLDGSDDNFIGVVIGEQALY